MLQVPQCAGRCHGTLCCRTGPLFAGEQQRRAVTPAHRTFIHGERLIDDTFRLRLRIAEVELPDGVHFEQYVCGHGGARGRGGNRLASAR